MQKTETIPANLQQLLEVHEDNCPSCGQALAIVKLANVLMLSALKRNSQPPPILPPSKPAVSRKAALEEPPSLVSSAFKKKLIAEVNEQFDAPKPNPSHKNKKKPKPTRGFIKFPKTKGCPPIGQRGRILPDGRYQWIAPGGEPTIISATRDYLFDELVETLLGYGFRPFARAARDSGELEHSAQRNSANRPCYVMTGSAIIDWLTRLEIKAREQDDAIQKAK